MKHKRKKLTSAEESARRGRIQRRHAKILRQGCARRRARAARRARRMNRPW